MEDCYLQLLIRTIHYNLYCTRGKYSYSWVNLKQREVGGGVIWGSEAPPPLYIFKTDHAKATKITQNNVLILSNFSPQLAGHDNIS